MTTTGHNADSLLMLRQWPSVSEIVIDGKDLAGACNAIEVRAETGEAPRLQLDLQLHEIALKVEGPVTVTVPPRTREALVALGWTPPEGH